MTFRKVHHMDIIANTSTILSIVIIASNIYTLKLTNRNLCNIRHKIVWNTFWVLTNTPTNMCANWIKITQKNNISFVISNIQIAKHLLLHTFSLSIRVCWHTLRTIFGNWNFGRIAINSSTGRKNQVFNTSIASAIA